MATFTLPETQCPIHLVDGLTQYQLLAYPAFSAWSNALCSSLSKQSDPTHGFHKSPYQLRKITIQAVDWFGTGPHKRLGFIKLIADISNDAGESLPGSIFMRGGSTAILLILQPDDVPSDQESEKYALLTVQPRPAAGTLGFAEIPAGMLDDSGTFAGAAAKEIEEETGILVREEDLVDMTQLVMLETDENNDGVEIGGSLQQGVYASPGGCDEFMPIFLYEKRMSRGELEGFQGKLTGLRVEGERITLKVVKLEDLWKEGARDGKTLAAWALYQGLKREGKI